MYIQCLFCFLCLLMRNASGNDILYGSCRPQYDRNISRWIIFFFLSPIFLHIHPHWKISKPECAHGLHAFHHASILLLSVVCEVLISSFKIIPRNSHPEPHRFPLVIFESRIMRFLGWYRCPSDVRLSGTISILIIYKTFAFSATGNSPTYVHLFCPISCRLGYGICLGSASSLAIL